MILFFQQAIEFVGLGLDGRATNSKFRAKKFPDVAKLFDFQFHKVILHINR